MKTRFDQHYELRADHWLLTGVCLKKKCGWTRVSSIEDEDDITYLVNVVTQHLVRAHGIGDPYAKSRKKVRKRQAEGWTDEQLRQWWFGERRRMAGGNRSR